MVSYNDDGYNYVDIIDYKYIGDKHAFYDDLKLNKILPECMLYQNAYEKLYNQNCPDSYQDTHYQLNEIMIIFVNNVGKLSYATYDPRSKKFTENLDPKYQKKWQQINDLMYFKEVA